MNKPGFAAALAREWRRLRQDGWDLAMLSLIPLAVSALIVWIFAAGIARDLPIVVIDRDHSALSRTLTRMLDASPGMAVAAQLDSEAEALSLLRQRRAFGLLLIPADFERALLGGRGASVQWFYNGQFVAHVGGLGRDVRTVVTTFSAGIELAARVKRGATPLQAAQQFEPIRLKLDTLFNESGSYEPFLSLALVPSMLQIFIALAAVVSVGRELKGGTVPAWLASAGGRWSVALAAKLALPLLAFCLHGLLFVGFFAAARDLPVEGSALGLLLGQLLLVLAYLGLGLLMIAASLSLRMGLSLAAFVTAPAFAYSGQAFPLLAMPPLARAWAEALPLTHYLALQSRCWLAGAPLRYVLGELLVLAAMALLFGGLGLWLLRRRALAPAAWGRR